ncbi:MAG: NUDIX hydrolase [Parvularculaceae bacterium]
MADDGAETESPLRLRSRRLVYENPWIRVDEHEIVKPGGGDGIYGVVGFKNLAIGILPVDDEGCTWLVGQHRYPLGRYSWEIPEGGGPLAEPPLEAAKRELAEETGLRAGGWAQILELDMSNCVTDERAVGFLAYDLEAGAAEPDDTEILSLRRVSFAEALEMAIAGEIRDALAVAMIFKARLLAQRGGAPPSIAGFLRG